MFYHFTYIKLPSFDMLSGFLACDDNNKLRDFAAIHPLLQLTHDFLDVGLHLVISGHYTHQQGFGKVIIWDNYPSWSNRIS